MKAINADNDNDGNDDDNDNDGSDDDSGNHDDNDDDDDIITTTMMATMPITTIMVVCPSYNQAGWLGKAPLGCCQSPKCKQLVRTQMQHVAIGRKVGHA